MSEVHKSRFTFRFAAVCFGLSALWELVTLQSGVFLFGKFVDGTVVAIYHLVYAALFAWLTMALWKGERSGYQVLFITGVVYTIDRLQLLYVGDSLNALLRQQLAGQEELVSQVLSMDDLRLALTFTTFVILLCWWGFVGYAHLRRDYFGIRSPQTT